MSSCLFKIIIRYLDITILDFAQQLLDLFAKHLCLRQPGNSACILDQSFEHGALRWKLFVFSLTFPLLSLLSFCVVLCACLLCLLFICEQPKVFAELHLILIAHNRESTRSRKLGIIAQRMSVMGHYRSCLIIRCRWQFFLDDSTRELLQLLLLLLLLYFQLLHLLLLRLLLDCLGQVGQVTCIVNWDFKLSVDRAGFLVLQ